MLAELEVVRIDSDSCFQLAGCFVKFSDSQEQLAQVAANANVPRQ